MVAAPLLFFLCTAGEGEFSDADRDDDPRPPLLRLMPWSVYRRQTKGTGRRRQQQLSLKTWRSEHNIAAAGVAQEILNQRLPVNPTFMYMREHVLSRTVNA